ncbi:MAG: arginine repressor [Pyrinomonadaceae bacterium]
MHKIDRHNTLLSLLDSFVIGSQSELASRLRENGFSVTQASVSRDLDELGVVKLGGKYSLPQKHIGVDSGFGPLAFETAGESLIVGRCASGLASAITVRIDAEQIPEIVGTVAGDDTIFIAAKDAAGQIIVLERMKAMFN